MGVAAGKLDALLTRARRDIADGILPSCRVAVGLDGDGSAGQVAWAGPESGLSFAYVTNGIDANVIRQLRRGVSLSTPPR